MRALQITELSGPRSALSAADLPDPPAEHPLTPGSGVLIDVHAAGVAFPEVLQTRGEYQYKPDLPFVPGTDIAGVVRSAPDGSGLSEGDRVAACCMTGGFAEVAVAPAFLTFPLPDALDFAQGASLVMNYHTAYFALKLRGRLAEGETVLVHGAAGGVGTATLQVAKGLGARTIAVVSSDDKERVARAGRRRRDRALRRALEGRGQAALRRRRRRGRRPRRRRPLHRQPALAARGRARGRGRLHRRLDPRGEGQPAAAEQRRRRRRRVGRLRDGQARHQRRDRRGDQPAGRAGPRAADRRRALPARPGGRRARADRRPRRDRQGRAGRSRASAASWSGGACVRRASARPPCSCRSGRTGRGGADRQRSGPRPGSARRSPA